MSDHDPIHFVAEPEQLELSETPDEPGWYFWTETWCDRCGPYPTEAIAREMLEKYCREVLGS